MSSRARRCAAARRRPSRRRKVGLLVIPLFHVTACSASLMGSMVAGNTADLHAQMGHARGDARSSSASASRSPAACRPSPGRSSNIPTAAKYRSLQPRDDHLWRRAVGARAGAAHPGRVRRAARQWLGDDRDDGDGHRPFGEDYLNRPDSAGPPVAGLRPRRSWRRTASPSLPSARSASSGRSGPQIVNGYWNKPEATRRDLRRRLGPHRRPRPARRGRLPHHRRPRQGHDHPRRREHLFDRGRERPLRPSRR